MRFGMVFAFVLALLGCESDEGGPTLPEPVERDYGPDSPRPGALDPERKPPAPSSCVPKCDGADDRASYRSGDYVAIDCTWFCRRGRWIIVTYEKDGECYRQASRYEADGVCE